MADQQRTHPAVESTIEEQKVTILLRHQDCFVVEKPGRVATHALEVTPLFLYFLGRELMSEYVTDQHIPLGHWSSR